MKSLWRFAALAVLTCATAWTPAQAEIVRINPSERTPDSIALYSGIQYGHLSGSSLLATEQRLDLLVPEGRGPVPVVVFVLGSGWRATSRERVMPQLMAFARAGYAVASIDYRGSGEARFPEPQRDVLAAVRFLRANGAALGIDPERIALMGNSAGGHLAVSAGLANNVENFSDDRWAGTSSAVRAIIGIYPALYLSLDRAYFNQHVGMQVGVPGAQLPEGSQAIDLATPDDPPVFIVHGTADRVVPISSSERFYDEATARGLSVDLMVVKDLGHSWEDAMGMPEVRDAIIAFLDRTVR